MAIGIVTFGYAYKILMDLPVEVVTNEVTVEVTVDHIITATPLPTLENTPTEIVITPVFMPTTTEKFLEFNPQLATQYPIALPPTATPQPTARKYFAAEPQKLSHLGGGIVCIGRT